jgi:hypothetical protein
MAQTLAESFLADLDELSDDEEEALNEDEGAGEGADGAGAQGDGEDQVRREVRAGVCKLKGCTATASASCACPSCIHHALATCAAHATLQLDDIEALNYDDLSAVAKLSGSTLYKDVMAVRARAAHTAHIIPRFTNHVPGASKCYVNTQ